MGSNPVTDPVVGSTECSIEDLCTVIRKTGQFEKFVQQLMSFAKELDVPVGNILPLKTAMATETQDDALEEILNTWRIRRKSPEAARLSGLLTILGTLGLADVAEEIRKEWQRFELSRR